MTWPLFPVNAYDFESGATYNYSKEELNTFCTLNKVDVYTIMSAPCARNVLVEYDNMINDGNTTDETDEALELFLYVVFNGNDDIALSMKEAISRVNIGTKRIIVSSLIRYMGIEKTASMLGLPGEGMRNAGRMLSLRDIKLNVEITSFEELKKNVRNNAYLWTLFSATGNQGYLKPVMNYIVNMPDIIKKLYPDYKLLTERLKYKYGILPPSDYDKMFVEINRFLSDKINVIAEYNDSIAKEKSKVGMWTIISYLMILNQVHMNAEEYIAVRNALRTLATKNKRYMEMLGMDK